MFKNHNEISGSTICYPDRLNKELPHVIEIGQSDPAPGYTPQKLYRNAYVLHFVISGKGSYYDKPVEGPCAFLEIPNTVHYYTVDPDPTAPRWKQYWIMFSGPGMDGLLQEAGFPSEPTVFPCPYISRVFRILRDMQEPSSYTDLDDHFYMLSALLQIFSLHAASLGGKPKSKDYSACVQTICNYIHTNYASITCEDELAQLVHLSTRYMHRIFKQETGISPIRYLNQHRISRAKALLTEHDLPVYIVSDTVGFSNPNYFCYVFQKHCDGISPLAYKKKHQHH